MNTSTLETLDSKTDVKQCPKTLGIPGALSIVIGCIIGSGIFMNVNETLLVSPRSVGLLIVYWILGGCVAIIGGLCYAELGCSFSESGGERTYIAKTLGSPLAVTFTYIYTYLIKGTTLAGGALTIGYYVVEIFLPDCYGTDHIRRLIAMTAILIAFFLNCISKKVATNTQIIFTVLKLLALVSVIIAGLVTIIRGKAKDLSSPFSFDAFYPDKLGNAFVNIFWATEGWNILSSVVGDMKNPKKNLPLVMIFGVLTVIVLYCLAILSYIAVLGYDKVMIETAVAVSFSNEIFGPVSFIIPIFIVCSAFGAINGNVYAVPAVSMVSAHAHEIPSVFGLVRREQRVPVVSIGSLSLAGLLFCFFNFQTLVKYCGFCTWVFYFIVMSLIYYVRYKKMGHHGQFRVFLVMPAVMQVVALYIIYSIVFVEKLYIGCSVMFVIMCAVFAIHLLEPSKFIPSCLVSFHDRLIILMIEKFDLTPCTESDI